jgi:hypothetical protein
MTQGSLVPIYRHYVPTKHRFILEDGTDRLSETSVTNYVPTLRNIPEEQRPQLYCGLKSHMMVDFCHVCKIAKTDYWLCHGLSVHMEQFGSNWTDFCEI